MRPLARQLNGRVRRICDRVVSGVTALSHSLALAFDRDHSLDKAIHFGLRLTLRRLDHKRIVHGEREGRSVETVVHQTARHIARIDTIELLELVQVEDHLVTYATILARIVGAELLRQRSRHIVCIDDSHLGSLAQTALAEHLDVAVCDRQQQCATPGRRRNCRDALFATRLNQRVRGEELRQVSSHADRTNTRTATAVRHCEGLVEVQVADVSTDVTGVGQTYLSIHICTVHIYLTTSVVHCVNDLADTTFEHAVSRGVGNHQTAQFAAVLLGLSLQILDVDITICVARYGHDLHTCHSCRCGVGTVSRCGDQHDVTVALTAALVVCADHHQTCILTRSARIGLQRTSGKARDGCQIVLQIFDHYLVTLDLIGGSEGVYIGKARQAERLHQCGSIQLHRTRTERDHTVSQRDIAVLQTLDVAHQVALVAIFVEYGLGQNCALTSQLSGVVCFGCGLDGLRSLATLSQREDLDYGCDLLVGGNLVEAHTHATRCGVEEVDTALQGQRLHNGSVNVGNLDRIEERAVQQRATQCLQSLSDRSCCRMDMLGNATQTLSTVINGIETNHRSHQCRCGTDVRRCAFALDVLLTHLESHTQSLVTQTIDADADDSTGHIALKLLTCSHITCARATESHRSTHTLSATDSDVSAPLSGSLHQHQSHQVAHSRNQRASLVSLCGEAFVVAHLTVSGGILNNGTELTTRELILGKVVADDLDTERLATCEQHVHRLREEFLVNEQCVATLLNGLARTQSEHHQHCLSRSGCLVQQRAVTDLHTRERDDCGLIVEQSLQTTLRDLSLIGGVRGVPRGVLEYVTRDCCGHGRRVVAHTDERTQGAVTLRERTDQLSKLELAQTLFGQCEGFTQTDRLRNNLRDQLFAALNADHFEHLFELCCIGADVARCESIE